MRSHIAKILIAIAVLAVYSMFLYIYTNVKPITGLHSLPPYKTFETYSYINVSSKTVPSARLHNGTHRNGLVCSGWSGRLGNMMFQFAAGYATARKYHAAFSFYNPGDKLGRAFDIRKWTHGLKCKRLISEYGFAKYISQYMISSRRSRVSVFMRGSFVSWKYFYVYADEIHSIFSFNQATRARAKLALDKVRQDVTHRQQINKKRRSIIINIIAVHVRLGDRYSMVDTAFIRRAMNYFLDDSKNNQITVFVIVSDNLKTCRKVLSKYDVYYSTCGNDALCDMAMMATSDGAILAHYSTFGWWGAWLSKRQVVYNKCQMISYPLHCNRSDTFPPHWIAL